MRTYPDLFGEIPVTLDDVLAWMLAVPGIAPSSPRRFAYYVQHWHVVERIQRAKEHGTFEEIVNTVDTPAPMRLAAAIDYRRRAF